MSNLKLRLLTGAGALLSVATFANSAGAVNIYGGGASLPAPYIRQAGDCYGQSTDLISAPSVAGAEPTATSLPAFNYTGTPAKNCANASDKVNTRNTIFYDSTGSGLGIAAFYSHNPQKWGDTNPDPSTVTYFPNVHFAMSDAGLDATQVGIYNNGGGTIGSGSSAVEVAPKGSDPTGNQVPTPEPLYGPMIQVPALIAAVAVAYDPVYRKVKINNQVIEYKFNNQFPRADLPGGGSSGGLRLDNEALCLIFNGQIQNWAHPKLKNLNANKSLKDPQDPSNFNVPLVIVGRSDSSGTTSIFTRHLAAVCGGISGVVNQYSNGSTSLPSALTTGGGSYDASQPNDPAPGETLGKFTRARGNEGVAKYIDFTRVPISNGDELTQGRVGYVGPDYTLPASAATGVNSYELNTFSIRNKAGSYRAPTIAAAQAAFGAVLPPQSDASGNFDPGATGNGLRSQPFAWAQSPDKSNSLADPDGRSSYPIVGTSNFLFYQCYANNRVAQAIEQFVNWYYNSNTVADAREPDLGILATNSFAPLPSAWRRAIRTTFSLNTDGLNLDFNNSTACAGKPGA
jgi:phosphate transport system substrate-binding protein